MWQVWAYAWLVIILQVHTPGEIDIWEAVVTLLQFPVFVFFAYAQDIKWRFRCLTGGVVTPEEQVLRAESHPNQNHNYLEYRRNACKMMEGGTPPLSSLPSPPQGHQTTHCTDACVCACVYACVCVTIYSFLTYSASLAGVNKCSIEAL